MYIQTRYSITNIEYYFICIPIIVLTDKQQHFLSEVFQDIAKKHHFTIYELIVKSDEVHIVFTISINQQLKKILNVLRGYSSFLMRKEFPDLKKYSSFWLKGFYISTIGNQTTKQVERAIRKLRK